VSEPVNDVAIGRPAPALRLFVERYTGYRLQGFQPGTHRGLPGRHLTFIISLSDPVQIAAMPDPRQPPAALGAFVSGLHDGPANIAHDGNQYGISLDLTPVGARALLGLPAGELADQAHLNRDWRDLAGCSPTVWLAEELPLVQEPTDVSDSD
jgi:hypothetical protein